MKSSLQRTFVAIWLFVVAASIALALLLVGLYRLGVDARVDAVATRVGKATASLQTRYALYARSFDRPPDLADPQRRRELVLILQLVLDEFDDVEGGFYTHDAGFIAYAFPSYEGGGTKQDVPAAESARIAALSDEAIAAGGKRDARVAGARQTLILEAAPVGVGTTQAAAWVMSRAHVRADDASRRLLVGLVLLGFFAIGSGLLLALMVRRWNRGLGALDRQLENAPLAEPMAIEPTGHPDLDRVARRVLALHDRLRDERRASTALEQELSRARRVASLGRMTAQLVHEVRNPLAAMRLRAENALAGSSSPDAALTHVLDDVRRLDDLLERMQAMTRLNALRIAPVALAPWLERCVASVVERAVARGVAIDAEVDPTTDACWSFDEAQMTRAVDNLLLNAIQHAARPLGRVAVRVVVDAPTACRITVSDDGVGIGDDLADQVFDPFFTTRADGTGLGLSIAREIVEAHQGMLRVSPRASTPSAGAQFVIELPWPAS